MDILDMTARLKLVRVGVGDRSIQTNYSNILEYAYYYY